MGNRILLADDSITIQKVVNLTFADEGIEVVSVSNGDLAEKRLGEVNPDLVLADIFMPGKNGYELCESIKQNPQFGNVPVVLLVGAFEPFDQAEARRVRADAHLTKPFESRTLVETVRKLISTSGHARTGSLSPAAPVARPGERQAEEKAQSPIAQPSPAPGFYAATPAQASNEGTPPAQDQHAEEDLQPLEIQLPPASYQEQHDLSSGLPWMEQTESLADVSARQEQHSDPFDLAPLEVAADDMLDAPSAAVAGAAGADDLMLGDEHAGLDLEAPEPAWKSGPAVNGSEMILELERPEDVYMREAENDSPVDVASDRPFNFNSGGSRGGTIRASSWGDSDVFKTQMLEPPAHLSHAGERVNTNPLEMPPASDFNRPGASQAGFAELQQETSSTLLAVDDPLGDVLLDEREAGVTHYDSQVSEQVLFGEQPASEEFDLEFNPQEQQIFDIPEQTAATVKTTGGLAEADDRAAEDSPLAIDIAELTAEPYAARETASPGIQPQSFDGASEPSGSQGGSTQIDRSAGWPESGLEFGSGFQTATAEAQPDQVEYAFNEPEEELFAIRQEEPGAEFTASSMWAEQEARFAPIDIEATPVDESEHARGTAGHGAAETGFEIAPTPEEARAQFADAPAAQALQNARPLSADAAAQTADLPPAVIDEIVRRVVSQMSESVVREIAWEVVPDVVERVIKEMARNEVSKRN